MGSRLQNVMRRNCDRGYSSFSFWMGDNAKMRVANQCVLY